MKYLSLFTKIAFAIFILSVSPLSQASAEILELTFSRPATGESNVSDIEFAFNFSAVDVQIDQLGATSALFQNNEDFGKEVGITVGGPVDGIGVVSIGEVLNPGREFVADDLNVSEIISPGENFYLGFNSGDDIGYFNIAWEPGTNSSIIYSSGLFATEGSSLVVNAIPEPSSLLIMSMLTLAGVTRRRRV